LWGELRQTVLAIIPAVAVGNSDEAVEQGLTLLGTWEGGLAHDDTVAPVFQRFVAEMVRRVVHSKAPSAASWLLDEKIAPALSFGALNRRLAYLVVYLMREQPSGWFAQSWSEEMADALKSAVEAEWLGQGRDGSGRSWGGMRPLTLRRPGPVSAIFGRVFRIGPILLGGDGHTVNPAGADLRDLAASPVSMASIRMVVDVGAWDECRFALPGGQSENPYSRNFDDLLPLWQRGEGVPIAFSEQMVQQQTEKALCLVPVEYGLV
jgi:penicillin amidase